MRKPCTTSALAMRILTGTPAGTRTQLGTKAYCCARMRTTAEPSGAMNVARPDSEDSPPLCSEVESIVSCWDGGCQPERAVAKATTPTIATMIAVIDRAHRRSAACPRSSPAASCLESANGTSREECEQVESDPDGDHDGDGRGGDDDRASRPFGQDLREPLLFGVWCHLYSPQALGHLDLPLLRRTHAAEDRGRAPLRLSNVCRFHISARVADFAEIENAWSTSKNRSSPDIRAGPRPRRAIRSPP